MVRKISQEALRASRHWWLSFVFLLVFVFAFVFAFVFVFVFVYVYLLPAARKRLFLDDA